MTPAEIEAYQNEPFDMTQTHVRDTEKQGSTNREDDECNDFYEFNTTETHVRDAGEQLSTNREDDECDDFYEFNMTVTHTREAEEQGRLSGVTTCGGLPGVGGLSPGLSW